MLLYALLSKLIRSQNKRRGGEGEGKEEKEEKRKKDDEENNIEVEGDWVVWKRKGTRKGNGENMTWNMTWKRQLCRLVNMYKVTTI